MEIGPERKWKSVYLVVRSLLIKMRYRLSNMLAGTAEDKSAPVQSGGGSAKAGGKKRRK